MNGTSSLRAAPLVLGFGTAVLVWGVGFLGRLPGAVIPSPLLLALLLLVLLGGGAWAGLAGGGPGIGALTGVVASLVNLLVLGSLLASDDPNRLVPSAALWIPGSVLLGAAVGAVGALPVRRAVADRNWTGLLAKIAAAGTLFLVVIGGLVTSHEAGLAVVDWPNSYGYTMFLYPLSRMVGGIFYEHSHRLFGSLVGLTTLALAVRLFLTERRRWVRRLGAAALLFVILQGILGGLRVTGHFTMSASPDVTTPNLTLAMVHGIAGQLFFALMVALAAVTSTTWRTTPPADTADARTDRTMSWLLLLAVFGQLVLGVRVRHTGEGALLHMTFAAVVLVVALFVAVRLIARPAAIHPLRPTGVALLAHTGLQILLGLLAYVVVGVRGGLPEPSTLEVIVATAHQTFGAILLANAALVLVWTTRLLRIPR